MTQKNEEALQTTLNSQYVKDLSFENPNSPVSLTKISDQANIKFNIDINAQKLNDDNFEVTLCISVNTTDKKDKDYVIFITELKYSGLFTIKQNNEEKLKETLLIDCPHLLFPFARRVISDTIRDGGFPPLMMEPINFKKLYQQNNNSKN